MQRSGQVLMQVGIWLGVGLLAYIFFQAREKPPSAHYLGNGNVALTRAHDGHFHIEGSINGHAVPFLIDTGASTVSVSRKTADEIGLKCQRLTSFRTANGAVQGCITRVHELTFGPFSLDKVTVAILPDLAGEALLGMNALKTVRLEQDGDRLTLSP